MIRIYNTSTRVRIYKRVLQNHPPLARWQLPAVYSACTRMHAGSRRLVFDLSIAHDRFGSSSHPQQNGCLSHPQDLDAPLHIAAQRKIAPYQQQYADNQNISFRPAIVRERVCCLLVLNLVSSTLSCIRQPRPRLRVLDVCGFV